MATLADVRDLLAPTSLPPALVDRLLATAPPAWLLGEPAENLAADLALCHPEIRPGEVRASLHAMPGDSNWRLTIAARDQPGLLAATCAVLADYELTLTRASAVSWPEAGLAIHSVLACDAEGRERTQAEWDALGASLRAGFSGDGPRPPAFRPKTPVRVGMTAPDQGHCLVTIEAPDQVGLLWVISDWFAANGCNIESVTMAVNGATARGSLLVTGQVNTASLASALGGAPAVPWRLPSMAVKATSRVVLAAAGIAAGLAIRSLRAGRRGRS